MLAEIECETLGRKPVLLAGGDRRQFDKVRPFLKHNYDIFVAEEGWEALDLAEKHRFFLIVVDSHVQGMGGYALARKLRGQLQKRRSGLIMIVREEVTKACAAVEEGLCDDYILAPYDTGSFLSKFWQLSDLITEMTWDQLPEQQRLFLKRTKDYFDGISRNVVREGCFEAKAVNDTKAEVINATLNDSIFGILDLLWNYHQHTYVHSIRSCALMAIMGAAMGFSKDEMSILAEGGLLHDLGKIQIPKNILDKPGALNPKEVELIREHPLWSARFIRDSKGLREEAARVAERHHERIDGSGYPYGLRGAEIDELSLVTGIADVFAAITESVPYRSGRSIGGALEIMREMRGKKLEAGLYDKFEEIMQDRFLM
ncbi:HD domain-containing phosphohydrolase [Aestuariispira insulae]|uniref:Putative nucleotidyltransferase with HDIG domain n=1 Tax=Aestuariispira insulae TaxID=1461337 RepID=A0A3D9HWQ4_9PROT|nr:HD domain-containing phosphohydrolase [Aestuariispira insulae]RED53845.1 putative nucleotidyltransferase with HDIG domain [Aestuariispira insulae]